MSVFKVRVLVYLSLLLTASALASHPEGVSPKYRDIVQARLSEKYAITVDKNGKKSLAPRSSLSAADLAWLKQLSETAPLAKGNSSVRVVDSASLEYPTKRKETIVTSKIENGVETVQLCPPNVYRDQIGNTCMLYARVHWLDIAGYYTNAPAIYKITNGVSTEAPWKHQKYIRGLSNMISTHKPMPKIHKAPEYGDNFFWAREQLRKGRPILAALPREIWQALPTDFIASRGWSGGSIGHQIVVNGFTYNAKEDSGTFHIVNTWWELPSFDLKLEDARNGMLVFEYSMSPIGEPEEIPSQIIIESVVLIKQVGTSGLYQINTNKGTRKIIAPDELTARRLVEEDAS